MAESGVTHLLTTEDAAAVLRLLPRDDAHAAFVVDRSGAIVAANVGAVTLMKLSQEEILRFKFWDLPSWRSSHAAQSLERILTLTAESTHDEDVRFGLNLGDENEPQRWEFKVSPVSDERPAALLIVDVQQVSQPPPAVIVTAEDALRFKFSFETARVGPWSWNVIEDCLTAHPVLADLFAWPPGFEFTNSGGFYALVHPDDREHTAKEVKKALQNGSRLELEYRIIHPDGSIHWIAALGGIVRDEAGTATHVHGITVEITGRRRAEDDARNAVARLEYELTQRIRAEQNIHALTEKLIDAQENERTRIARELHDDLSQQVAALSLGVSNVRRQIGATRPDLLENIDRLHGGLVALAKGIRFISHQLHPAIIEQAGVSAALKSYCTEFTALTGIRVNFSVHGATRDAGPAESLCLYRIAQEALQNVAKHSRSDVAGLALIREGDSLRMTISDRGVGCNLRNPNQGLGFVSIRERVRLVGGSVSITSGEGGTTVAVTVPVSSAN